jgi:long-chain acyl-CoA synthetase
MYPGTHAPDKPAVVMAGSGRTVTYGELDKNSARLAAALNDMGLRKGDVIAMLTDNAPEAFEIYWAAMRSGLYVTAVNWHLAADEAAYILADCSARVVIASAGVRDLAEQVAKLVPTVERWFAFGGPVDG